MGKPIVTLIDCTGRGNLDPNYAMNILIFAKSTRLEMTPNLWDDIVAAPRSKKEEDIAYIANTIPSSWEFIDYTFLIQNVTRAFTHQLVRTRTASYAQQTMRTLDVSGGDGWTYGTGPTVKNSMAIEAIYDNTMDFIAERYKRLIESGAKPEDARGILPTNIHTNIMMKMNMRNFVDLVRKRSSLRVQDEFRIVIGLMVEVVLAEHPWMVSFLSRTKDNAINELELMINDETEPRRTEMLKKLFQIRTT